MIAHDLSWIVPAVLLPDSPTSSIGPPPVSWTRALNWGTFLGVSWTWVIGMWLPAILLADFGPIGFVVFALPNCLGAAAMGYVLSSPDASKDFVSRHAWACRVFSFITLAFQFFVLASMMPTVPDAKSGVESAANSIIRSVAVVLPFAVALIAGAKRVRRSIASTRLAWATYAVSLACAVWYLTIDSVTLRTLPDAARPVSDQVGLLAACLLGFVLCPYLDLTFHRARQQLLSRKEGTAGFFIGFCGIFASMILFTALYAPLGFSSLQELHPGHLPAFAYIHIAAQVTFKILAHGGYVGGAPIASSETQSRFSLGSIAAPLIFGLVLAIVCVALTARYSAYELLPMSFFEMVYRSFLGMYGLVFPAYVWLCSCPIGRLRAGPTKHNLTVCAVTVLVALPFFAVGFLEKRYEVVTLGAAAVLLGKVFTQRLPRVGA